MASRTDGSRVVRVLSLQTRVDNLLLLPPLGLMLWQDTDTQTGLQTVNKARMDGTDREILFSTTSGLEISNLTSNFDMKDPRVYWISSKDQQQSIVELRITGNIRRNILTNLTAVTALCSHRDKIYYARSEGNNNPIYILDLNTTRATSGRLYRNNSKTILSLLIYDPELQMVSFTTIL